MKYDLSIPVTDRSAIFQRYYMRDGFIFQSWNDRPLVFDVLVIRNPANAVGNTVGYPISTRTFDEHIELVKSEGIERVEIIADDLSFIAECPSVKSISVFPPFFTGNGYDYSPLYNMKQIERLSCRTSYGDSFEYSSSIDYSKIKGLKSLSACGKGHLNYAELPLLERLFVSNDNKSKSFYDMCCSTELKDLTILQCGIKTLDGIQRHKKIQSLNLWMNKALCDVSLLSELGSSLRSLDIESCSKITDFSFLKNLVNLEYLRLCGNNNLPNLSFLNNMMNLKKFSFSMLVEDGDLKPCLNIPCVYCEKGKKHYNMKDKDLPKQRGIEKFTVK